MVNTPNLLLPLQATGSNSGTWGTIVNNQILSVLDLELGGQLSLSVAGNSDVTLNAAQQQPLQQSYTGLLTGNINVIFGATEGRFYVVNNATTGAFTLTVKPAGGTGVVVPAAHTMLIFMNVTGTKAQEVIDYITALTVGTLTLGTGLTVAQGGTGAATLTSHGLLVGEGTGAVVGMTALSDGQIVVGQTGADPLGKTLSADATLAATGALTISAGAVTLAKMANMATASFIGRTTAATGVPEVLSATQSTAILNAMVGDSGAGGTKGLVPAPATGDATKFLTGAGTFASPATATIPVGLVVAYAGTSAPSLWLLCYGQAIDRTTYATLFAAISTTYGVGNGTTTFNVPDLRGRIPAGADNMGGSAASRLTATTMTPNGTTLGAVGGEQTHTLTTPEMPAHVHSGAVQLGAGGGSGGSIAGGVNTGSTGGGGAHNNVQPTMIMNSIIFAGV